MSKRHIPADFPEGGGSKRSRNALTSASPHKVALNFDTSLYDELVLVIFAQLSWIDLCAVQQVNKRWSRLTCDNQVYSSLWDSSLRLPQYFCHLQLWKALFLKEFGRPRLRGLRGYVDREDGREIKPLPSRASPEDIRDWKWMFRISLNWKNGILSRHAIVLLLRINF